MVGSVGYLVFGLGFGMFEVLWVIVVYFVVSVFVMLVLFLIVVVVEWVSGMCNVKVWGFLEVMLLFVVCFLLCVLMVVGLLLSGGFIVKFVLVWVGLV